LVVFSLKRCQSLVVPSGFLQQVFADVGQQANVVPNIIDTQRFCPAAPPSAPRVAPWRLLVARNLEPIYDNATALRAFAQVRQRHGSAQLTLAGTGPEEPALRALAQSLNLADGVHFTGRLDREAMAELLRNSHVAINPSLVDNMPNSVLEAMASGVPVVSTNVGGVPFIVRDGVTALLVPPADACAMAQALLRVMDEPALAQRLSAAALAEVQRYTWDHVAPQWAAAYAQAMASASNQGLAA
jgi:glycosyltransferase involved in cell wall biosynthesis